MTLLELVNGVLDRLREEQVSSVSTSPDPYTLMLVAHVNDAKRHVENAWDWSVLRELKSETITSGTATHILTDSDQPGYKLHGIYNSSHSWSRLRQKTLEWARANVNSLDTVPTGKISTFWMAPPTRGVLTQTIGLYPTPDSNQGLQVDCSFNQPDLSDDADILYVPSLPVLLFATAYAARERGEAGGTSVAEWMVLASRALSDAVAYDSARYSEELIWTDGSVWPTNNKT